MKKLSIACGLLIASGSLFAQQYTLSTIAGTGPAGYSGDGGPALGGQLSEPIRVALDSAGNIYISDLANNSIRVVSTNGTISTFAGNGSPGYSGDGGQAAGAEIERSEVGHYHPFGGPQSHEQAFEGRRPRLQQLMPPPYPLFCDGRDVGADAAPSLGRIAATVQGQAPVCAGADSDIVLPAPIAQVMS